MKREEVVKKVDSALTELEKALAAGKSETLKNYLRFLGSFHTYSLRNLILIYTQCPEATYVAGYRKWPHLGRHVRKGEKAIRILAPLIRTSKQEAEKKDPKESAVFGFRTVSVFDVSQTDGEELPELGRYRGKPVDQLVSLEKFAAEKGIDLIWEAPECGALGISKGGTIMVDPSLEIAERFATLAHEIGHELLHRTDRRKQTTRSLRETEAEAVAFAVCSAVGVESNGHAADYIQLYQGDVDSLKSSLDLIRKAASEILSSLACSVEVDNKDFATA